MTRNMAVVNRKRLNLTWQMRGSFKTTAVICLGLMCGLSAPIAMAEITRHCDAEVKIVERGTPHVAVYNFTVHKTVDRSKAYANELRRNVKRHMVSCLRDHWHIRDSSTVPRGCLDDGALRIDFINYPFNNLNEDIVRAVCPELRPGADDVTKQIDLTLTITGERGCNTSIVPIAENVAIACPHAEVTLERIENEAQPAGSGGGSSAAQEQPVIGDGGGSGCVGAGCSGSEPAAEDGPPVEEAEPVAEDLPADDGLPATASYNLLPFMRLPGNDLRLIEMSAPNWMLCRQACTDDARCRAYTYRAPNASSGPVCLLKSGTGMRIPDTCCQSGVKR